MKKNYFLSGVALLAFTAGALAQTSLFTTSGTYTVPANVDSVQIEMIGAGGSGGGNGTGGGGGGGYSTGTFAVVPLSTYAVTVGAGGSGTATSISGLPIMATAGGDGVSVSNPNVGGGGAGGVGSGGTVNRTGGTGGGGYYTYFGGGGGGAAGSITNGLNGGNTIPWTGICQTPGGAAGIGGGSPGGDGGKGAGFTDVNCNVTDPAGNGMSYGGGGGGGNGNGGGPGTGGGGYCLISPMITTGVHATLPKANLLVVQNPFTDKIRVTHTSGNEQYQLLNAVGQIVWSGVAIEQQDFSYLESGVYFLKANTVNAAQTFKLVKQ